MNLSGAGTLGAIGVTVIAWWRPRLLVYAPEAAPVPVLKGQGGPQ